MTTLLHIDASVALSGSTTRAATARLVADLAPDQVIRRDLAADPLPQIDDAWAKARLVPLTDATDQDRRILALSDTLVSELETADTIVIGLPIYNFGMPASLKAWVDLIARPKRTFHYGPDGPKGLLQGKSALIAVASGGTGIGSDFDFATPHLSRIMRFIGIDDITIHPASDLITPKVA